VNERNAWVGPFVGRFTRLADPDNPDRAVLAHLRRGLGEPSAATLCRVGWLFNGVPDDREEKALDAAILAAGLFAWAKGRCEHTGNVNFGRAFGAGLDEDGKKQREKRFTAILDTPAPDLPPVLRQAITLIEGVPLDWGQLIADLMNWDGEERRVQKNWARGFWWNTTSAEPPAETLAGTE
jgi:CRISPR type I-E-associated protein CasB/Cse2